MYLIVWIDFFENQISLTLTFGGDECDMGSVHESIAHPNKQTRTQLDQHLHPFVNK